MAEGAQFAAGLGLGDTWGACAKACLDDLGEPPAGANLGFLYATDALADDLGSALTFLRSQTGIENWVGAVGPGIAATGREVYERPAVAVLLGRFPEDAVRVFDTVAAPAVEGGLASLTKLHGDWLARHSPVFGVVHGDPRNAEITDILSDVTAATSTFLVGGLSASRTAMPQIAGRVTEGGLSGVLFDPGVGVATGLTQGCTPIGVPRTITAAAKNVIMEIDGRPALEVFKEEIGELLAHDLRRVAGYIFAGFPIQGSDTGDYLVRNLTAIDPTKGWIAVGETVEPGRRVVFCRRDHDSAIKDLRRMVRDVKQRAGTDARAALYFSCIGRGRHQFGADSAELRIVRDELGDLPLVGFFGNGEISNDRLYGYTGVLAVFR